MSASFVEVEMTGETIGEAKWLALRELERQHPGLDRELVSFDVLSEGERGLLGVGTAPARVVARFDPALALRRVSSDGAEAVSDRAALAREVLEAIGSALGGDCQVEIRESGGTIQASLSGPDISVLIGKHGKTIDAIQYVVGAILAGAGGEPRPNVVIDAGGYRSRREARLTELANRSAERVLRTGNAVTLEPMTSTERKIVHLHLKDMPGIETRSDGEEPNRCVIILLAR